METVTFNHGSVDEVNDKLLIDIDGFFVTDVDGNCINLGGGTQPGGDAIASDYIETSISTAQVEQGVDSASSTFESVEIENSSIQSGDEAQNATWDAL